MSRRTLESRLRGVDWAPFGHAGTALRQRFAADMQIPPEWVLLTSSCTAALSAAIEFVGADTAPIMTYSGTYSWGLPDIRLVDCGEDGAPLEPVDIGVDLWGLPCDDEGIKILDAAHRTFDPERHNRLAKRGVAICYSFGPQKEIPTPQGGMLVWRGLDEYWEDVVCFLNSGALPGGRGVGRTDRPSIKGLMPEAWSSFLGKQLTSSRMDDWVGRRREVLETYNDWFGSLCVTKAEEASGHLCVVRFPDPAWAHGARARLDRMNVHHRIHYPVHHSGFPEAVKLSERLLTVPCHVSMTPRHAAYISRLVLTV